MKKIIVIYGPTASGKSAHALSLAKMYDGAIINADSLQLFKDLPILTARPSLEEEDGIEHFLYGILSSYEQPNAMLWRTLAIEEINKIYEKGKQPIIVGGTGLYLMALLKGLSPIPHIDDSIKLKVKDIESEGNFFESVIKIDPNIENLYHPNDHKRLSRALSVYLQTGKSIVDFFKMPMIDPYEHKARKIYLCPTSDILYKKIERRFLNMIERGAIEEVDDLYKSGISETAPIFNTLGAKEILSFLKNEINKDEMILQSVQKTRQYAKRQYTWFNNQMT